ncbi:MAG: FecR domain-containing protein [Azospirillaceae bacterium]|nr:FecR domain-containing protein [Azospirillaceae bacterium]
MSKPDKRQDEIDTAAADWAARLAGGPLSLAERRALDGWRDRDPAHGAALDEAQAAWALMGQLRAAPGVLARDIVPAWPTPKARRPLWRQMAAAAACLLLLVGGARLWLGDPLLLLTADARTNPGQQRSLTLADGSVVELGPASAIATRYSDGERRVALLAGVAYFTVAPMAGAEHRPFVVEAAGGTARALGTQFMVDRLADAVDVTVTEHTVAVTEPAGDQRVLSPGQAVRYSAMGLEPVREASVELATAWRQGRLVFDHQPLGEVVATLNRYRHGRIVVAGAELAARTVSGVFDTTDPDATLATVARELHARTAALPPLVTVLY